MIDFSKPYEKKEFVDFLSDFLPDKTNFLNKVLTIEDSFKSFKKANLIAVCKSIENLHVIEIEHTFSENSRVTLSREIFRFLSGYLYSNALLVVHNKREEQYRFSFVKSTLKWTAEKNVKRDFSNPRRLSFLLGPNAKIHTPTSKLIKAGKIKDFNDLECRFNIEIISEEFFNNYKKSHEKLLKYLKDDKKFYSFAKSKKISKKIFSTKVLGQILFTYFIQKKRWLGAEKDERLYYGDINFLRNSFNKYSSKNFYNDFLEYLFYEGFNKKNKDSFVSILKCKVPFLNGGLFSPLSGYNWKKENLIINNDIFSNSKKDGILDIFDLYNFTVNESDPLDKEVGIDPEMLGKVFERLIDINGVVYTPKIVVQHMCEELIKRYFTNLKSELNLSPELIDNLIKCTNIEKNTNLYPQIEKIYKILDVKLKELKIIDPAVGSGQFTTGMLSLITDIRQKLNIFFQYDRTLFQLKKSCIQNSIYGIDIIGSSVEIARLRLWLSLIVDENRIENISALPNLDYKIYQSNSLIKSSVQVNLFNKDKLTLFTELKQNLYEENDDEKVDILKTRIQNTLKEIADDKNSFGIEIIFNEIFENKNPGFDIVIGNPPYESAVDKKRTETEKEYNKKIYPEATGSYDEFILFLLRGLHLLKKGGVYSWIIKNSFLNSNYSEKTKNKLINHGGLINSIDVSTFDVFHSVGVYPIIITGDLNSKESFKEYSANNLVDLENKNFYKVKKTKTYKMIKDFKLKIFSGTAGYGAKNIVKLLETKKTDKNIPFIVSGNVDRYRYSNNDVRYMKKRYTQAYIKIYNQRSLAEQKVNFYRDPKIVIAGMTKKIEAVYIKEPIGLGVGIYGIYSFDNYDPYFLTGLLNSEFCTQYLLSAFKDKHLAGGYISINKTVIEKLPFTSVDKKNQDYISNRSIELHKMYKKGNDSNNIAEKIEKEINNKVNDIFL